MADPKPYQCQSCEKRFKTAIGVHDHTVQVHYFQCVQCSAKFETTAQRVTHQSAKSHFQCARCQPMPSVQPKLTSPPLVSQTQPQGPSKVQTRSDPSQVNQLKGSDTRTVRCDPCNRTFVNKTALEQHLWDKYHPGSENKEPYDCEDCGRRFLSAQALQQHNSSTVHKPLAKLRCVDTGCNLTFESPSALIMHLEGGRCPSGWTREKINFVMHMYDEDRVLTTNTTFLDLMASSSISGSSSVSSLSNRGILTPSEWSEFDDSEMEQWSLVPSSSGAGQMDINTALADQAPLTNLFCPLCLDSGNKRVFKTQHALKAHLSSVAHAEKTFKCPLAFAVDIKTSTQQPRLFTTLSGLTQHLESGQCKGGKSVLWKTLDYLQKDVLRFEWPGKLLKN